MKLIVGLGNPGKDYEKTRHNIGFMFLDYFVGNVKWSEKFNGSYYETNINGEKFIFLKPLSYMNLSGGVVSKFMNFYKIDYKNLLVIHDDLDLPVGKFRIKVNSSAGGHNGIKDIINCTQTNAFARVKIGVSNNKNVETKDYVLGRFGKSELEMIESNFSDIKDIVINFDYNNITSLMNKYN